MDRELVNEWFRFANMDLELAKHTIESHKKMIQEFRQSNCLRDFLWVF